jgi:uncharacterized protein
MGKGLFTIRSAALFVAVLLTGAWAPPDSPVADAAMRGERVEAIRRLVRAGADVNAPQGDGMTALHWASENGDPELAKFLVESGANLTATTRLSRYVPLHFAAKRGHEAVLRVLLVAGSDPEARTASGGATALHLAAQSGSRGAVAALLEHGADVNVRESARGQTPLMFAAADNRLDVVRFLLDAGADASLATHVVDVPAATRVNQQAKQVRDAVLAAFRGVVADPDGEWRPTPGQVQAAVRAAREVQRSSGTPMEATPTESGEEVPAYQPDWASRVGTFGGLTALLYAAREGHADVVTTLLDAGADIDQPGAGDRTTPLLMAAINGRYDLAMLLIERGADPNIRNTSGDSPLYAALETRWAPRVIHPAQHHWMSQRTTHLELMEALLRLGAEPDARLTKNIWYSEFNRSDLGVDFRGATPFFRATHALDLEAMKLLVAYGADVDVPTLNTPRARPAAAEATEDPSGLPPVPADGHAVFPIHAASGVGHGQSAAGNVQRHMPGGWMPVLRYLVEEHGADVNMRDHGGFTPLHNAAARGDNEMILYLVERGADVTVVSRTGLTTADMANSPFITLRPIPETIALLEGLGSHNNGRCLACGDAPR